MSSLIGIPAGNLSAGMLADLVVVNLEHFHLQPALPEMVLTNLVHSARGSDVDMVMVDGKITVKNGELQSMDQRKILMDLKNTGETLMRDRAL